MTHGERRHIFVYGTLMRSCSSPYARLLQARATFAGEAATPGRLYNIGRFPGAVFGPDSAGLVHGEVFRLNGGATLDALDAYEACRPQDPAPHLFARVAMEVRLAQGGTAAVWAYAYIGPTAGRPLILSGRYRPR
jgi:gamma-glutamylcyclotransferase (GGCT)/AIG2-like uncharacterized protein YtfP